MYSLKHEDRTVKLKKEQLSVRIIGQVFKLFPDSILLCGEDGTIETSTSTEGTFDNLDQNKIYEVQGVPITSPSTNLLSPPVSAVTSFGHGKRPPPVGSASNSKKGKFTLRSFKKDEGSSKMQPTQQEDLEWRKIFEVCDLVNNEIRKKFNLPVTLTPYTANIEYITNCISVDMFNGEDVVLLDNENYKIPNTLATNGNLLWCVTIII